MSDEIKMNYAMMDEMASAFTKGAGELDSMITEVNQIASILEDGALIGDAGDAFSRACREALGKSVANLKREFQDLERDIRNAVDEMQKADQSARGYYQ